MSRAACLLRYQKNYKNSTNCTQKIYKNSNNQLEVQQAAACCSMAKKVRNVASQGTVFGVSKGDFNLHMKKLKTTCVLWHWAVCCSSAKKVQNAVLRGAVFGLS